MEMFSNLADLRPGDCGRIWENRASESLGRRLFALGFAPGSNVECLFSSGAGDPRAYRVRGTVIALRQEDAAHILVLKEGKL